MTNLLDILPFLSFFSLTFGSKALPSRSYGNFKHSVLLPGLCHRRREAAKWSAGGLLKVNLCLGMKTFTSSVPWRKLSHVLQGVSKVLTVVWEVVSLDVYR